MVGSTLSVQPDMDSVSVVVGMVAGLFSEEGAMSTFVRVAFFSEGVHDRSLSDLDMSRRRKGWVRMFGEESSFSEKGHRRLGLQHGRTMTCWSNSLGIFTRRSYRG
jgi:hypothetical protein